MVSDHDRRVLQDLARQVADAAALPVHHERRELWQQHNDLELKKPLMLIFPEGSWRELIPKCEVEDDALAGIEFQLRSRLYTFEHFQDDTVLEKAWPVRKVVRNSGWGLQKKNIPSTEARGAWHFDPVIHSAADLKKLTHPTIEYDDKATQKNLDFHRDLFGDILDVKLTGVPRLCYHLMNQYTGWRGLEEMMMDMYCEPQMLHDAMAFLTEGHKKVLQQHLDQDLLELNNDYTYQGSGGNGYCNSLPQPDHNGSVRPIDMWGTAEAQELAQVGPEQHEEFSLRYEKELLAPFGLNAYGCCEDLTNKLDLVFQIPNIRRISIAPWADVDQCAAKLKGDYIFSWKPNPSHLVGDFNEAFIRSYIRHTINVAMAHDCVLELVLKDTHTCEHHPERFDRWTQIAREEIEAAAG